ncbi:MAG: hypothetical protein KatS3mg102_3018 [Planctomycetota bacterium]|nr:MAG: hypothetical protein KatS3mg102_3018 [Planctomycetota bacterium]
MHRDEVAARLAVGQQHLQIEEVPVEQLQAVALEPVALDRRAAQQRGQDRLCVRAAQPARRHEGAHRRPPRGRPA